MAVRVMIIDNSALIRRAFHNLFQNIDGIDIVGSVRSEHDAITAIQRIKPDVIMLNAGTYQLGDKEVFDLIKKQFNIPVIVCGLNGDSASHGMITKCRLFDYVEESISINGDNQKLIAKLERAIKTFTDAKISSPGFPVKDDVGRRSFDAVVIGSSTGGPRALAYIVNRLPDKINVPIFIVQHLPKKFTASLAERMNNETNVSVVEAKDGLLIKNGIVYLAPGDYHMILVDGKIQLTDEAKIHGVRPAADYLFDSASKIYRNKLMGVILTGMGKDGTEGMTRIKQVGGYNIVQNEETSIVYGMPGSAVSKGIVDEILSLEDISRRINQFVR